LKNTQKEEDHPVSGANAPSSKSTLEKLQESISKIKISHAWKLTVLICGLLYGFFGFAYPLILDHADGKWGGQITLELENAPLNKSAPTYFLRCAKRCRRGKIFRSSIAVCSQHI
jgi:hypothetical protein